MGFFDFGTKETVIRSILQSLEEGPRKSKEVEKEQLQQYSNAEIEVALRIINERGLAKTNLSKSQGKIVEVLTLSNYGRSWLASEDTRTEMQRTLVNIKQQYKEAKERWNSLTPRQQADFYFLINQQVEKEERLDKEALDREAIAKENEKWEEDEKE